MSVAAMTIDERPLMNNYDKMPKQFEQNIQTAGASLSGPASPTPSGSEEPTTTAMSAPHHQYEHHHHIASSSPSSTTFFNTTKLQNPTTNWTNGSNSLQQQHSALNTETVSEERQRLLEEEIENLKAEQTRLLQQCADAQRREKILMRRLANKEQEFQDYVSQIAEYKAGQAPNAMALRSALLDPAVNLLFEKLKKELKATKAKLEETQNELSAWKFTPDSNTGKRLMAKCRLLYQENEELGKMTSNGRLAKLETELAMQKSFSEEVKKSQSELDDFLQELDEDVEGMQSTILFLQQELKLTRDRIQTLEKENYQLKNGHSDDVTKSDTDDAINSTHAGFNGNGIANDVIVNVMPYHNIQSQQSDLPSGMQHPITTTNPAINDIKYQTTTTIHETIDYTTVSTEFYNGNDIALSQNQNTAGACDDGGSSSSNNSACGPLKYRTAASRKRNFDNDTNETIAASNLVNAPPTAHTLTLSAAPAITHAHVHPPSVLPSHQVSAPRCTLPPKKSKLRVSSPARRASIQSMEVNESLELSSSQIINLSTSSAITPESVHMIDTTVSGIIKDEQLTPLNAMIVDE